KLLLKQFDILGETAVRTNFAGRELLVTYDNRQRMEYGRYRIVSVQIDNRPVDYQQRENGVTITRSVITALDSGLHQVEVVLG
ncbi:MAG TPA: hypothetical protein VEC37_01155, partial [Bacillota bacterium]|nr:hypothetical protein [Bacillota bacterium]